MINYLPYTDFSIDNVPSIDEVYINNTKSTLLDDIIYMLNKQIKDITKIKILKDGTYKYCYNSEKEDKCKNVYKVMVRVNEGFPLFKKFTKYAYKYLKKLHKIEISLRWFNKSKENYLINYEESDMDDYIYSYDDIMGILTFNYTYNYLINYYIQDYSEMRKDYFLVEIVSSYFKSKSKGLVNSEFTRPIVIKDKVSIQNCELLTHIFSQSYIGGKHKYELL